MTNTPITDKTSDRLFETLRSAETEINEWRLSHKQLELAANKLHSQLSIWVNTANTAACGHTDMKDIEALAELELLRKS